MKTCEVIEQSREFNYKSWKSQLLPPELREHCRREGGRIVGTGDEADLCEWCLLDTTGLCAHEFPAAVGPV